MYVIDVVLLLFLLHHGNHCSPIKTGHVIEIVTKLFLVVQNSTGKPPAVNISTEFEANFGTHNVTFQFKVNLSNFSSLKLSLFWVIVKCLVKI